MKLYLIALTAAVAAIAGDSREAAEFFEMKVRPVLANNCYSCHAQTKMGGLDLSSRETILAGGNSGAAVQPGDPDGSLLIRAVRQTHDRLKMPPAGKLPDNEIEALVAWIRDGAEWPDHPQPTSPPPYAITPEQRSWWSFQPVKHPKPPEVQHPDWAQTPIDRFVLAALEAKGLRPVGPADRRSLIRRATYDLTGLPPTPKEVEEFLNDNSEDAFAKVVDRLLASPRYGEQWGRYWLDIARYADAKLNATEDELIPNVWRYRDWVIQAVNDDMPYDKFVKAQIAGDLMEPKERYIGGLGFFANSPNFGDDRVDALTRGFMALTVACARCHDHKFDPIATQEYYSLLGVFENTDRGQYPLVEADVVERYESRKKRADEQKEKVKEFEDDQASELAAILAAQSTLYLKAARSLGREPSEDQMAAAAREDSLDAETLDRWVKYLDSERKHPFLDGWQEASFDVDAFQRKLLTVIQEKKRIDQENLIRLGGKDDAKTVRVIEVLSLERDDHFLWRELVSGQKHGEFESGILYYKGEKSDRFLAPHWKQHVDRLRADLELREEEVPQKYPYLMTVEDVKEPKDIQIHIRGDRNNLGAVAPRRFLSILSDGEPPPLTTGSGRFELAEAIAGPANPLTSRVIMNRVWMYHFGRPLVGTPGNFGRLGEKPTHPELLDYLASRLIELNWSLKSLHREIMLTRTYALSVESNAANENVDADNKLFWRANRRRLDVEPMRDTLLAVSGELDESRGGPAVALTDECNTRRTVYGQVSRRRLDGTLALFDFPNPMSTSDGRIHTATPLQQLYFLNSEFVQARAKAFARRLERVTGGDEARIQEAYNILFQRSPDSAETKLGLEYLASGAGWPQYAQALLSSNELLFVD